MVRSRVIPLAAALVAAVSILGFAATATAHPTQTSACSGCHGSSTSVHVTATQTSNNGTTAAYHVTVSGGSSSKGWAVLSGSTNVAHASASSGNFSVAVGRTFHVWAVDTGLGANMISISPVAPGGTTPPPAPAPSPTPSGAITIRSSASAVLLPRPFVLSGILGAGKIGDKVVVEVKKPGSARWSYSSARLVYAADGSWWYRYTPRLLGTYTFRVRTAVAPVLYSSTIRVAIVRTLDGGD